MTEFPGPIRVTVIGRHARRCLDALHVRPGTVFAVFEHSAYLCDDATGDLACIGPLSIGAGPVNALSNAWPSLKLRPGDPITPAVTGARLAGGPVIETDRAVLYTPDPDPIRVSRRALTLLAVRAAAFDRTDGMAALVTGRRAAPSPLLDHTAPAIAAIAEWLHASGNAAPPDTGVDGLLGLGPGLTPSGDDYLGGMMIALFATHRTPTAGRLAETVMARAEQVTSRISLAHLAAAADGEGSAALHQTLGALHRSDKAALDAGLAAIDRIGHSSGWDALAGAVAALTAQADKIAAAVSDASAFEAATTTPAARSVST